MPFFWTEKRTAALRDRWSAGDSASVIADVLGTTRNAIIGKGRRLGLSVRTVKNDARGKNLATAKQSGRNTHKASVQAQVIHRAMKADRPSVKPETFTPRVANVVSSRKNIVDIGFNTECHYPDDNRNANGDLTFCGHPVTEGSFYCAEHHAIVHSKCIRITEADRSRRKAQMAKLRFGSSHVGNPAEVA